MIKKTHMKDYKPLTNDDEKMNKLKHIKKFWEVAYQQMNDGNIKRHALRHHSKFYPGIWIFYGANYKAKDALKKVCPFGFSYDFDEDIVL